MAYVPIFYRFKLSMSKSSLLITSNKCIVRLDCRLRDAKLPRCLFFFGERWLFLGPEWPEDWMKERKRKSYCERLWYAPSDVAVYWFFCSIPFLEFFSSSMSIVLVTSWVFFSSCYSLVVSFITIITYPKNW